MRRPGKFHFLSEINITPLTDVMLVLLIIFMATSTIIITGQAINLNLPSAVGDPIDKQGKFLLMEIDRNGKIYLDGNAVSDSELENKLFAYKESGRPLPVIIRADKSCKYENFISVLELLSETGFDRMSLAVKPKEKK
ncbi:MAG: biopolymer transporter ExbD [Candidatus Eremiobacteraeota bacterium]|nr:biopolymer transporter ExbD [Candidatus Eremiobacteraeota bacterium]